jgi:hypothetical protein
MEERARRRQEVKDARLDRQRDARLVKEAEELAE